MKCPICSGKTHQMRDLGKYKIRQCESCWVEYCDPMPKPSTLRKFYSNYRDQLATDVLREGRPVPSGAVLDYGCGNNPLGIGYDPYVKRYKRFPKVTVDWVTMWGVLEHLTDPIATLKKIRERFRAPVVLTTVSVETPIPYRHKPPEHTFYFTRKAIEIVVQRAGYGIKSYEPYRVAQDSDTYLATLLRTMPEDYRKMVDHCLPKVVCVPTNEVVVTLWPAH